MNKTNWPIAWFGEEREGKNTGLPTLFIRGGYEREFSRALGLAIAMGHVPAQVYFGAGSRDPKMEYVDEAVDYIRSREDGDNVLVTIEIQCNLLGVPRFPKDPKVQIIYTLPIYKLPQNPVTLKLVCKVDKELLISNEDLHRVSFDDVNGKYQEDVIILHGG